jgi:exopolyphosphatase/guanosine-5'-triphosphate,3'-diphosphate pyrophosphatase
VEQVRRLALQLFDRLAGPLGAEPGERAILETAAILHDVGQLMSYRKRHRHSYELIMHADRLSLPSRERPLVALVARYHRKGTPSRKHPEFAALAPEERAMVRRLAAILRVADGLDRGYTSVVESIRTRLTDERLRITLVPKNKRSDLSLETWGAGRRTGLLGQVLGREIVLARPARRPARRA